MTDEVQELLTRALTLSMNDRAELVGSILRTLEDDSDEDSEAAWQHEIAGRLAELDAGDKTVSWLEIRNRLTANSKKAFRKQPAFLGSVRYH